MAWAEIYLCTKWHLDPSSHLATTDIGKKLGGLCYFFWGGQLGPHVTQCGRGQVSLDPSNRVANVTPTIHQRYKQTGQWSDSKKLKPGLVASYDIQPGNREGLFWFRRFINLSLTYLDTYLPQSWTNMGLVGRQFVKRFALCYQTVVCLCL